MAHRYKMLPSQILELGTTFDLYVIDVSSRYQTYLHDKAHGNQPKSNIPSQAEMVAMIKRARGEE
jgi:hypothetical protein